MVILTVRELTFAGFPIHFLFLGVELRVSPASGEGPLNQVSGGLSSHHVPSQVLVFSESQCPTLEQETRLDLGRACSVSWWPTYLPPIREALALPPSST